MDTDINVLDVAKRIMLLGISYLLALPVAWNREQEHKRNAGLRTFPLVAVGACGYALVGIQVLDTTDAESRVIYGIITGIGFIGGGAILKDKDGVTGTATAASLWITGAIGIATAFSRYEIAIALSLITFLTLLLIPYVKDVTDDSDV